MAKSCTVCSHPQRVDIDSALVAGQPFRYVAERSGTSATALFRHKSHLAPALAWAKQAVEVSRADDLLAKVQALEADARRIGRAAEDAQDLRTALAGVRELTRIVELVARLRGELQDGAAVNVLVAPDWLSLRKRLLDVLSVHPEALKAVVEAIGA